jgi:small subunit ribosomal protein S2
MSITTQENDQSQNQLNYLEAFRNLDTDSDYKTDLLSLLMNSDAHYGHQISSYNPLMRKYLYGEHGDIHVINLTYTIFLLKKVLNDIVQIFSESNARMLFIGSKEQLVNIVKDSAERCGQYYVNHRWFGGTLTNWTTIQKSIKKMNAIEKELANPDLDKKTRQSKERVYHKLINSLGGIRKMPVLPDIVFITDVNRERVAVQEANKLKIPVIALLDSNSDPRGIDYPIPCNDDSQDAVALICQLLSDAVLTGMESAFEKRKQQNAEREQNRKSYAAGKRNTIDPNTPKETEDTEKSSKKPRFRDDKDLKTGKIVKASASETKSNASE